MAVDKLQALLSTSDLAQTLCAFLYKLLGVSWLVMESWLQEMSTSSPEVKEALESDELSQETMTKSLRSCLNGGGLEGACETMCCMAGKQELETMEERQQDRKRRNGMSPPPAKQQMAAKSALESKSRRRGICLEQQQKRLEFQEERVGMGNTLDTLTLDSADQPNTVLTQKTKKEQKVGK